MSKKSLGIIVVEVFAFFAMLIGFAIIVVEAFAHYRPYFTHLPTGRVLVSEWTVTPFIVGGVLIAFGALVLGYTIVKPAMDELEDASSFVTNLISSVKLWGSRSTDKQAVDIVAKTGELPVPDAAADAILAAEAEARKEKHVLSPPIAGEGA
jgi:hypothetical protein